MIDGVGLGSRSEKGLRVRDLATHAKQKAALVHVASPFNAFALALFDGWMGRGLGDDGGLGGSGRCPRGVESSRGVVGGCLSKGFFRTHERDKLANTQAYR